MADEVVSLADLWGEHSPLIAAVEYAKYLKRVGRHGFGTAGGSRSYHQLKVWRGILQSLGRQDIRIEDRVELEMWVDEINGVLGNQ